MNYRVATVSRGVLFLKKDRERYIYINKRGVGEDNVTRTC